VGRAAAGLGREGRGGDQRQLEALDRLAERADKRLQRSLRSLATARKLLGRAEPVPVEAAIAAKVEGTVNVEIAGRVDVEVAGTFAVAVEGGASQVEGDAAEADDSLMDLFRERAGLAAAGVGAN
jgi:hypothetical protein